MQDDPPEEDDVKRYLKKQRELTERYSRHNAERSIRNANQPPSYDGSEECIDFDCDPDASQAVINQETVQETVTVIEDSKPTTAPHLPKRNLWKQVYHYGYLLILFAIALFILWLGIMERLGIGYLPLPW